MRHSTSNLIPQRAFTFIEVLAALLFLAILLPVIAGALSISNRASITSERSVTAGELAENKLNELLIGSAWASSSETKGDFGQDQPGFRWELSQSGWTGDPSNPMTLLTMAVFFPVQGQERSVRLSTLVTTQTTGTNSPPST